MATPAWISLGSNLGDRRAILDAALKALAEVPGVAVLATSLYHQTSPVGGPPGQGPFLNAAARLETTLDPFELLAALQKVERRAGRVRRVRWGERTLDLDILVYGTTFLDAETLKLPHPRLALRRFVLAPLAEIDPTIVDTLTGQTIANLLANLDRTPRLVAVAGPEGRLKATVMARLAEALPALEIAGDPAPPLRSPEERPVERSARLREAFAAKVRSLGAGRRALEAAGGGWAVAGFHLDPAEVRQRSSARPETFADGPADEWSAQQAEDRKWGELYRNAEADALLPTFVLKLPGGPPGEARRPGSRTLPALWPESNDPDTIIAEALATCRGIESP